MFRRSDTGKADGTNEILPDNSSEDELDALNDEIDALGAPLVWNVKTALAWSRRQNWHLNGIEKGAAVWDAGNVYIGRLITPVIPEMSVETPATFDRAAQTGQWSLFVHNARGQQVFACESRYRP